MFNNWRCQANEKRKMKGNKFYLSKFNELKKRPSISSIDTLPSLSDCNYRRQANETCHSKPLLHFVRGINVFPSFFFGESLFVDRRDKFTSGKHRFSTEGKE